MVYIRGSSFSRHVMCFRHNFSRRLGIFHHANGNIQRYSIGVTASGLCIGFFMNELPSPCSMEASIASSRPRRRRPPKFGSSIPIISRKGFVTSSSTDSTGDSIQERENCPMCKKFGSGPCGDIFKEWLACTDQHPGNDSNSGEPMHLTSCAEFAEKLAACLVSNTEYYEKYDAQNNEGHEKNQLDNTEELKGAWKEFVHEMENGIKTHKYSTTPFPKINQPKMEVRLSSRMGAAFFASEMECGSTLIAAYILDQDGNVLAAGSREDMDMESLGCVLQFDVPVDLNSASGRAIYDTGDDPVTIFSKTMMVPKK